MKKQPPTLRHDMFIQESKDYDILIKQIMPLLDNPSCGDLIKHLITAFERAKYGGIFHIFVQVPDKTTKKAFTIHNDPDFQSWSDNG